MKKVMGFGTFDLLHEGHKYFLKEAKNKGDHLTIIVARDSTVKKVKGSYPYENETVRVLKVKDKNIANEVILGNKKYYYSAIFKIKPEIICLGHDQTHLVSNLYQELKKMNLESTKIIRLDAYKPEMFKSSIIKSQLAASSKNNYSAYHNPILKKV